MSTNAEMLVQIGPVIADMSIFNVLLPKITEIPCGHCEHVK